MNDDFYELAVFIAGLALIFVIIWVISIVVAAL